MGTPPLFSSNLTRGNNFCGFPVCFPESRIPSKIRSPLHSQILLRKVYFPLIELTQSSWAIKTKLTEKLPLIVHQFTLHKYIYFRKAVQLIFLTPLHSERPKLHRVLTVPSAKGLCNMDNLYLVIFANSTLFLLYQPRTINPVRNLVPLASEDSIL